MRHGRRRRLIAGFTTTLGLWAAGAGCQSAGPAAVHAPTSHVAIGQPVAARAEAAAPAVNSSGWTTRAAAPAGEVSWHAAPKADCVAVAFHAVDAQGDSPAGSATPSGPEPVRGQPPEGKKPEGQKEAPELPLPHAVPVAGAPVHVVPSPHPADAPRELAKQPLPPYVIEPPDILLVEAVPREGPLKNDQPIRGQHLVRPDGTVGLGIYGSAFVGGMTIEQARDAIFAQIRRRVTNFDIRDLNVDVLAYNSKFYYVVTDGGGYGEQVYPFPITGSETVLDALGRINGLPPVADKRRVWVSRRAPGDAGQVLPVDWCGIVQRGATSTNYQLMPGDRVYVKADRWMTADSWIGKRLSPIERILGATLLGSETVNSIKNRSGGTSSSP
jgi:polysaccharide export outer membrane protein